MTSLLRMTSENVELYLDRIHEIEIISFPSPWSIHAFRQEARNPVSYLWALFVHSALVGYICFWLLDIELQLVNVAVHPHARGKGLGNYLLTKMMELGLSKGIHHIWLEVRQSNTTARSLYEKFGFEEVGRRRNYYTDNNEDAIVMSLTLLQGHPYRSASN